MDRLLLRPKEAADTIGISVSQLYNLMAGGTIFSVKIGNSRRIPVAELERYVASLTPKEKP